MLHIFCVVLVSWILFTSTAAGSPSDFLCWFNSLKVRKGLLFGVDEGQALPSYKCSYDRKMYVYFLPYKKHVALLTFLLV